MCTWRASRPRNDGASRRRAIADTPHHPAAGLAARRCGDLVAAPLAPGPAVAHVPQGAGSVRGELVPSCDFPLGLHRETAGCGMVAITFVHFPGRRGAGWLCRWVHLTWSDVSLV